MVIGVHNNPQEGSKGRPWGQPLMVVYQSLVVSGLILTLLFFLLEKYNRIRSRELLEKPYAFNMLISKGGHNTSNAFDMSVDKTPTMFLLSTAFFHVSTSPLVRFRNYDFCDTRSSCQRRTATCLLSKCSKTFPTTVNTVKGL